MRIHRDWRGGPAFPFEPPASRAAARTADGWGVAPGPRNGALVAERRTVVVATHVALAHQAVAVRPAETLRLPNVRERVNELVSGLRERPLDASAVA